MKPNFEIVIERDGVRWPLRKLKIRTKGKRGGFAICITQNEAGDSHETPVIITGYAAENGTLSLVVSHDKIYLKKVTKR